MENALSVAILTDLLNGLSDKEILKKYKITIEMLQASKSKVIKQLPTFFQKTEPVSYAIRFFLNLLEKREFTVVLKRELNFTVSQCSQLYEIVTQRVRPTYGMIFLLRTMISPVSWYYKEGEELPESINFNPIYTDYSTKTWNRFAKKMTCGHHFFEMIKASGVYTYFCEDYGMTKAQVGNYVYMKKVNGEKRYCVRPSYPFVNAIKKELPPDYWYMFPEEVLLFEESIKQLAYASIARHKRK